MKMLLRWTPALLAVLVCGCRSNISHELLERELLAQENQIFQLQDLVDEYETKLDSCRRENQSLLAELGRSRAGTPATTRKKTDAEELAPPVVEPGAEGPALPFNGPQVISPPDAHVPEGEHMAKGGSAGRKSRLIGNSKARSGKDKGPVDLVVTQITLNRKLTGGHNVDGHPGDEGVMVVVEPLNAAGDLIEVAGEISIVVLDPTVEGDEARIARWDFNSQEAADHIKRTPMGDGLHFDLRWPHSPPVHRVLNLYVRYTTSDGRRLQVEKQIEIDPPCGDESVDRVTKNHDAKSDHESADDKSNASTPKAEAENPDNTARRSDQQNSAQKRGTRWEPYR